MNIPLDAFSLPPMTIVTYIANSTIPSRTANSIHVMKMCEAMAEYGCDVELIYPIQGAIEEVTGGDIFGYYGVRPNFKLKLLARPFRRGARYYFAIRSALRAKLRRSELAYCRNHWAAYFCALFGIDTVFEAHAPLDVDDVHGVRLFEALIRRPHFQQLIVITLALRDHYVACFPALCGKIAVLPDAASPLSKDTRPMRLEHTEGFCVGYVGQLYRGKGMELIVQLAPLCPWARFHIVGGFEADIDYWKSQCEGVHNVSFHGFVPHALVPGYLLAMDAVVLPNQNYVSAHGNGKRNISEWTSPLKAFEYMAAGKAIIASDLPALREIFRDGENALLCAPESPSAWLAALERLRSEPGLRHELEKSARDDFECHYSWRARARLALDLTS